MTKLGIRGDRGSGVFVHRPALLLEPQLVLQESNLEISTNLRVWETSKAPRQG